MVHSGVAPSFDGKSMTHTQYSCFMVHHSQRCLLHPFFVFSHLHAVRDMLHWWILGGRESLRARTPGAKRPFRSARIRKGSAAPICRPGQSGKSYRVASPPCRSWVSKWRRNDEVMARWHHSTRYTSHVILQNLCVFLHNPIPYQTAEACWTSMLNLQWRTTI